MIFIINVARVFLVVISLKQPKVTRSYIYIQSLYILCEQLIPRDYGQMHTQLMLSNDIVDFSMLYFAFWPNLTVVLLRLASSILIYKFMSLKPVGVEVAMEIIAVCIFTVFYLCLIHFVMTWVGLIFVETKILRNGNEQLLHGLKEGVIILDEEHGHIAFLNKAAKRFQINDRTLWRPRHALTFEDEENMPRFELSEEMRFVLVDVSNINSQVKISAVRNSKSVRDKSTRTLYEIVSSQLKDSIMDTKKIYRVLDKGTADVVDTGASIYDQQFVQIRVRQQNYLGKESIAIYILDATEKMHNKVVKQDK